LFFVFNRLLKVVFEFLVGGVPLEALLDLLVLEKLVPVLLFLKFFVVFGEKVHLMPCERLFVFLKE
jgi:hypothetical protein